MDNRPLYILVGALTIIALGVFFYKVLVLKFPLVPDTRSEVWDIEVRVQFEARGAPAKASLYIPRDTRRYVVEDENFVSRGFGVTTASTKGNRRVTWSVRRASGRQVLYYKASTRQIETHRPPAERAPPDVEKPDFEGALSAAADEVVADVRQHSADTETMARELLKRVLAREPDANVSVLVGSDPTPLDRIRLAADLLQYSGIPARVAHGIRLRELERSAPVIHWLQVYDSNLWRSYDPVTGEPGIADEYFTWWRGDKPLLRVSGGANVHANISVSLNREAALLGATSRAKVLSPNLMRFSLWSLPLDTQAVYHVLLMVPLGALVLVILRNLVGLKTFGTFMPVLIALAFRETQLIWGLVLFSVLIGLGLSIRFFLARLKLLLVPRLAAVLIIVVLLMALISVLSHQLGLAPGLSVALFPMVIMTMTIERMSIVWEERGPAEAIQQAVGSLAAATLAYSIMRIEYVDHVLFVFPEMMLLLLALTLLLGRYSGYRLSELLRFRALLKE